MISNERLQELMATAAHTIDLPLEIRCHPDGDETRQRLGPYYYICSGCLRAAPDGFELTGFISNAEARLIADAHDNHYELVAEVIRLRALLINYQTQFETLIGRQAWKLLTS